MTINLVHLASAIWIVTLDAGNFFLRIILAFIIHVTVNTVLFFSFCVNGEVKPFALPLMWMFCIFTLVIYCFYFMSTDFGRWGPGLAVVLMGYFLLAPTIIISILTGVIFYIVKWLGK